jgi:hypothetical protein
LQVFNEEVVTSNTQNIIEIRGVGSSFVLTDASFGKLGTQNPQPYLGDSRPAFTTMLTTTPGSPFVNNGLIQVRDFLIGSSNAVAPTHILIGSGTLPWSGPQTSLQYQTGSYSIQIFAGENNQVGSCITIIPSVTYPTYSTQTITSYSLTSGVGFNGTTGLISGPVGNYHFFESGVSFTMECWFKTNTTNDSRIFGNLKNTQASGIEININRGGVGFGSVEGIFYHSTGIYVLSGFSQGNMSDNNWHHVALVRDATNNQAYLYLNGSRTDSQALTARSNAKIDGIDNFHMGGRLYNTTAMLLGSVDEMRISNVVRYSGTTIPNFGSVEFSNDANTTLLWHLNEGTGTTTSDASAGGNTGGLMTGANWCNGYVLSGLATAGSLIPKTTSEIGISGGGLIIRDIFSDQTIGTVGSEMRIVMVFRIGS